MRLAMAHNAPASLPVHAVMHRIKTYNAISPKASIGSSESGMK